MTEASSNDGLLRAKPPRPSISIGRDKVLVAITVIGVLMTVGIVMGKPTPKPRSTQESSDRPGLPSYNVISLPSTYADMPAPTPTAMPRPKVPSPQVNRGSGFETLEKKLLEERIQRARSAKLASVSFQSFTMPNSEVPSAENQSGDDVSQPDTAPDSASARDADNRQDDKNTFLNKKRATDVVLNQRLMEPTSPYQLMAGTVIPGLLLTGLNSDLPGQILGQVSQNVFDTVSGNHLLLPQGTKVVGQYDSRIVYGQERMLIVWTRLILPNGKSLSLEGMPGVDLSGAAGLSDQVNHHWGRLVTGVVLSSILGAGAQIAQGRTYSTFDPDYGDLAAQGFAQNMNQVGQQIIRKNLNIQPTIEIRPGYRFNVFVHKDMALEPYSG
jgi:type IV secretory pathway VirB10-like protein